MTTAQAKVALEIARKATAETLAAYTAAEITAKVAHEAANQASRVAGAAAIEEYAAVTAYHAAIKAAKT